jgi:hypothetical protein
MIALEVRRPRLAAVALALKPGYIESVLLEFPHQRHAGETVPAVDYDARSNRQT